jgi:regulator of replication initiation timing
MKDIKINDPMLYKKYEALLNGIIPEDYKDHILNDKISLLKQQNMILENTILSLRHELSSMIASQNSISYIQNDKKDYSGISLALKKCIETSEVEISHFNEVYVKALEAIKSCNEGFNLVINTMKSRLFPPDKKMLDFINTVIGQVNDIKDQLISIQNYVAMLEFNDKSMRDSFNKYKSNTVRSQSTTKIDPFEQPERLIAKRYAQTLIDARSTKNSIEFKSDDMISKVNSLKITLGKIKNQRDQTEIENQKLLLQLKQAKEQLALCEENSAAKDVQYENKIKRLGHVIYRVRELPGLHEIVTRYEREVKKSKKSYKRSRSTFKIDN